MRSVKDGKAVHYVYDDAASLLSRISDEENADFVYLGDQLLARINDEIVLYYLNDHLGTTTMSVDASGAVVWSEELGVFGNITGKDEFAEDYAYYPGKEYEAETGLYYFNACWYDAELGRFISEDPVKDGLNWYAYCSNNPLIQIDPSGLSPQLANVIDGTQGGTTVNEIPEYGYGTKPTNQLEISLQPDQTEQTKDNKKNPLLPILSLPIGPLIGGSAEAAKKVTEVVEDALLTAPIEATKLVIKAYSKLRKQGQVAGTEVHHILEKRLLPALRSLGLTKSNILSIRLVKDAHQVFTNAWRDVISYGQDYRNISIDFIWEKAQDVYADHPELLDAVQEMLHK